MSSHHPTLHFELFEYTSHHELCPNPSPSHRLMGDSDDEWETDPDFQNNLTDAQRRAFGNKETMDAYTKAHGGGDFGGAVERAALVKPKSTAQTIEERKAEEEAEEMRLGISSGAPGPTEFHMPKLPARAPTTPSAASAAPPSAAPATPSDAPPRGITRSNTAPRTGQRGSVFDAVAGRAVGEEELKELRKLFKSFDKNGSGGIDIDELQAAMAQLGISTEKEKLQAMISDADKDGDRTVNFDEFVAVVQRGKTGAAAAFTDVVNKQQAHLMQIKKDNMVHSFAQEECLAFVNHINHKLGGDADLAYLLPISTEDVTMLFPSVMDGVLLCKLINEAQPETIDERVINVAPSNTFHQTENLNLAINAAKGIGLTVVNIGAGDLMEGKPHLVLGLIWQMVKMSLLANINLKDNPNLIRLLKEGESLEALLRLPPEKLLMRWFNFHLERSGCSRRLGNWGRDLQDSELYAHLLQQIDPDKLANTRILSESDLTARAKYIVSQGTRMGAEFKPQPQDIVKGNEKLNLGFAAALFNACSGLDPPNEENLALLAEIPDDEGGDSREERAFRMWINSLGIEKYVNNLFDDVSDGMVILQTMDHVRPGVVDWAIVNINPTQIFKKIENLNYGVDLGKSPFKFSLVGVQGNDIVNGNKKLTLALIWQLMRYHLVSFLERLRKNTSLAGGAALTDSDIAVWANDTVRASGSKNTIRDFSDKSLSTGLFLIDLLAAVEPRCVDRGQVMPGATAKEQELNAKYAISSARKLGCSVFLLWEDIVEVRPKMVLSFIAAVMAFALEKGQRR
ncbi:hypothetical protein AB1Y20_004767 [Prymnesium parvum]|uniref:Fimbrin n=1 Tax=Prymnesium parvum TaxID=97485 RepID=A0AB34IXE3_PRYPA